MVVEQEYVQQIGFMIFVLNTISSLSLIFISGVYICGWKSINSRPMRLVFYLCISCLVQNMYFTFATYFAEGLGNSQTMCAAMGVVKTGADLSSIFWTFVVTYTAYASIVKRRRVDHTMEVLFLLFGFLLPYLLAVIPVPLGVYGSSQYYCWFDYTELLPICISMLFYILPLWGFFITNTVLFTITYLHLKDLQIDPEQLRRVKRLLFFPLILFFTAMFSTIHRILLVFNIDIATFAVLDYLTTGLYGFFNAVAYGLNPKIQDYLKRAFCKRCLDETDRGSTASDTKLLDREIYLAEIQT